MVPDSVGIGPTAKGVGRYLIEAGRLSVAALARAQRLHVESGERLETVLTRLGLVSERDLADAVAALLGLPIVTIKDFPDAPVLETQLSRKFLKQARLIPISDKPEAVTLAMADPLDDAAVEAVRFAVEKPVRRCIAYPADFDAAYDRLYGEGKSEISQIAEAAAERTDDSTSDDVQRLKDSASEAPVIRLVNLLITRAVEARASDIHIEPMDDQLRVRYRIDGVLHEVESPPQS